MNFKNGDIVQCIGNADFYTEPLEVGSIYTFNKYYEWADVAGLWICIQEKSNFWEEKYFILASEAAKILYKK